MTEPTRLRRGRDDRRAARQKRTQSKFPFGPRGIPAVEMHSTEVLEIIEHNAETVLEEIGVLFRDDPTALALWKGAGADVRGSRVHIPRGLARALLKSAPREFTMHARNPARNVTMGGNHTLFSPVGGPPFVRDLEGVRRYATLEDLKNFVKLTQIAPAIQFAGGTMCEPVDVPANVRHLDMQYTHFRYCDMPCEGTPENPVNATDACRMADILFGEGFLETHPVLIGNVNSNSPLTFDSNMSGSLRVYASRNQGVLVVPAVLAGAMGPVTAVGCMTEVLAETLAGMALAQIVRPGTPVIMGSFVGAISMRTGAPTFGTAESTHMIFATAQLARRLGVPCRSGGSLCASKVPDAQAAYESMQTLFATVMAGVNVATHSAGWLEGGLVASYEKFVLDADQLSIMMHMMRGMDASDSSQALSAIREVGPGGHFLGCQHTQDNYEEAFYQSTVADYSSFEQWHEEGALTADVRANRVARRLLAEYEDPGFDPAVDEAIQAFMVRRRAEIRAGLAA